MMRNGETPDTAAEAHAAGGTPDQTASAAHDGQRQSAPPPRPNRHEHAAVLHHERGAQPVSNQWSGPCWTFGESSPLTVDCTAGAENSARGE
jgi:hypothetical protein